MEEQTIKLGFSSHKKDLHSPYILRLMMLNIPDQISKNHSFVKKKKKNIPKLLFLRI